jgi:hypothetical protein
MRQRARQLGAAMRPAQSRRTVADSAGRRVEVLASGEIRYVRAGPAAGSRRRGGAQRQPLYSQVHLATIDVYGKSVSLSGHDVDGIAKYDRLGLVARPGESPEPFNEARQLALSRPILLRLSSVSAEKR